MRLFDRALLAIFSIVISLLLLVGLLIFAGWTTPLDFLAGQIADKNARLFYALTAAVLLLAGIRLFWSVVKGGKPKALASSLQSVVHENEHGQVRISLKAIENLVSKDVSQIAGIREVRPSIVYEKEQIIINVNITVSPEVRIPELSETIQIKIKDRVREVTGVKVESVWISVDNITVTKPRVE